MLKPKRRSNISKRNRKPEEEGGMTLKRRYVVGGVIATLLVALFALSAMATDAEVYLASDSNGQNRVTNIQEGDEVWIV
ncbi:MAG TPA: hypothetical protein VMX15_01365, partial [Candidatus Heimdallarchaeota archaeon]|nr:hypothetical protein [Candidatus Heimdallarchaeota archaeon]